MASTSDIRNGLCINFNNAIYTVVEFQHVKPGKGNAFVRTKLKSILTGRVIDNTFPAGHKIDPVRIERRAFQFLYKDDQGYHFMNNETYDQVAIQETMIDHPEFLKEGGEVDILYHAAEEMPLVLEMPSNIVFEVTYTEPGVRGDTATNALKKATIETGASVKVPLFINEGDLVKIDTKTGDYLERVKK
jgi:elongation factor P